MIPHRQHLILATVLAAAGLTAQAQTAPTTAPAPVTAQPGARPMPPSDPAAWHARMRERHTQRLADLKTRLKLSTAQEAAWTRFTAALQPPAQLPARPDPAEWAKLTTPERIDRMQTLRAEHNARQDRRAEATKAFYAELSAEQKKVFDAQTLQPHPRTGRHGRRGEAGPGPGMGGAWGYP